MHEDDADADGIEEGDIDQEALHLILGLHGASAVLDEEDPATELLQVGKCLDQGLGTLARGELGGHQSENSERFRRTYSSVRSVVSRRASPLPIRRSTETENSFLAAILRSRASPLASWHPMPFLAALIPS